MATSTWPAGEVVGAGGVLDGSVVLRGNGDPTMRNRFLNQKNPNTVLRGWIARLVSLGIKRVNGDFVIDASAFGWEQDQYPEAWDASHRNHAYATLPSALALTENPLRVSVKPSSQ
ncbi:MAG: D-alanyl-D-alanine carboxypeptidase, partial [Candidatus Hydrogenedentes bacterium]|nr:D-alanyl-D-alanine carboxypeptidase [Candidatus Hydrogenedentota bacterium]